MNDIKNKNVVITGASKGIGEATARYLARKGANVILLARNKSALDSIALEIRAKGTKAEVCAGDVSNYTDVAKAMTMAVDIFGSVDVLVNNAGLIDPVSLLAESDVDAWCRIVDINYKGVYHGLRSSIPLMLEHGGTIINISSGAATSALEGWSHYCSTKAAVLSLTKCAHKEYFEKGINVIGLSPGTVATDMQVAIRDSGINPVSQLDWSSHIPTEWVAKTIGYLITSAGKQHSGTDFSLKNDEGRKLVGLPTM
jgi:NADP-dependent 3-hydroxy acid dehydrogenase YdfG